MFKDAVIIAGGMGSRMRPLTDHIPKPLVRVNNIPLIHYVINLLRANNIENINVTYGYKGQLLVSEVFDKVESLINTEGKDNSYFLFNTNIRWINHPIVVCPCDMIAQIDLEYVYKEYVSFGEPPACIVPVKTDLDADSLVLNGNKVTSIARGIESSGLYASGIQILNPYKINQEIPPLDNFYQVWYYLIERGMLFATNTMPTEWKIYDRLKDLV